MCLAFVVLFLGEPRLYAMSHCFPCLLIENILFRFIDCLNTYASFGVYPSARVRTGMHLAGWFDG